MTEREQYEAWFRDFYKQEPMPELGALPPEGTKMTIKPTTKAILIAIAIPVVAVVGYAAYLLYGLSHYL